MLPRASGGETGRVTYATLQRLFATTPHLVALRLTQSLNLPDDDDEADAHRHAQLADAGPWYIQMFAHGATVCVDEIWMTMHTCLYMS